eukprot:XP_001703905.1 Hypothetical protein GL50803_117068 [Giardia lamblia ATCC 50803]
MALFLIFCNEYFKTLHHLTRCQVGSEGSQPSQIWTRWKHYPKRAVS